MLDCFRRSVAARDGFEVIIPEISDRLKSYNFLEEPPPEEVVFKAIVDSFSSILDNPKDEDCGLV